MWLREKKLRPILSECIKCKFFQLLKVEHLSHCKETLSHLKNLSKLFSVLIFFFLILSTTFVWRSIVVYLYICSETLGLGKSLTTLIHLWHFKAQRTESSLRQRLWRNLHFCPFSSKSYSGERIVSKKNWANLDLESSIQIWTQRERDVA